MKKNKKRILIPVCIIAFLAAVYVAGVIVFSNYMFPDSFITNYLGKFDVSLQSDESVERVLEMDDSCPVRINRPEEEPVSFDLKAVKDDASANITGEELLRSQSVYAWPVELLKKNHVYHSGSYQIDNAKLSAILNKTHIFQGIPSEDAYITANDQGVFEIVKEKYGTEVDPDKLLGTVENAIRRGKTEIDVTEDMYIKPDVTAETKSLKKTLKKIVNKVGREITIDMYGKEEKVSAGRFYDTEKILKKGKFELLQDKIDEYMTYLDEKYTTLGRQRSFINHKGKEIKVGASDTKLADSYGFILNKEATQKELERALKENDVTKVSAVWDAVGNGWYDVNGDIGDTYIEISLKKQHLWYYKNGKLFMDSDVVTGLPIDAKRTPAGVFTVFWKDTNTRLTGRMGSESWDVTVDYWLSVTYTGIGIHTAPWQPSFGGDAYTYRGSHGCINVPYETGKTLYENVDVNTVVVIY